MKKLNTVIFCVIIVFAMMVQTTFAQDDVLTFGVKGGINLANVSVDPGESGDMALKFGVGGVLLYPLSDVLDLQVEALYLLKGSKDEIDFLGTVINFETNLAYLSIPVMGRYALGSGDISPYVVAGPEFGLLLSAEVAIDEVAVDVKDDLKSIEIGFNIGVGASKNNMFGEVRYSLGLTNLNDDPDDPDSSAKNTGIQAFVGMMF